MPTIEDIIDHLQSRIVKHGRAVQFVMDNPPFCYTIGNLLRGQAEYFIIGVDPETAMAVLNDLSRQMEQGALPAPYPGQVLDKVFQDFPGILVEVDLNLHSNYLNMLRLYAEEKGLAMPPVFQLVWPDTEGCFPWQPGYNEKFRAYQPLLGPTPHLH